MINHFRRMLSEDFYSAKCSCKILLSNSYRCVIHSDLCLWLKFQNINVIIIIFESLLLNFYDINKKKLNYFKISYGMEVTKSRTFKYFYSIFNKNLRKKNIIYVVQWVKYDKGKVFFSSSFALNCFKKFQDHRYLYKWYHIFLTWQRCSWCQHEFIDLLTLKWFSTHFGKSLINWYIIFLKELF